ncbi:MULTISPECIES: putative holin-like toxin [unclassified Clostridium]|uniref:putative holin-like toxin n=1 Tax=unclassified Clostridium TaxID=2614128 RepID=UPI00209A7B5C|nr:MULTISPECIES: putative holin-like toxin [unclassified Clostridium]WAG69026.1 putative holin-like toxin [Clostridium sp. CF011]
MSNDTLMLLFTAGIFLIALLTFIVLLIEKNLKKIVAPPRNWMLLFLFSAFLIYIILNFHEK